MMAPAQVATRDTLEGAPEPYRTPANRPTLAEAQAWCKRLAETHYENFHVATFFLPASLKPHFHSLYAFCRTSDDLGDEVSDTATGTRLLGEWREMLHECFLSPQCSRHPVFVALQPTLRAKQLPREPFDDLITAFEQDQVYTRHESLETLEGYSRFSANPVGRLVLLVSGYRDPALLRLSDEICTGLQLANFYQDVVTDWTDRQRRYLPADIMARYGVTDEQIAARRFDARYRAMMEFLVADAEARLRRGARLVELVKPDLAATLSLFVRGGQAILAAIKAENYNTLRKRPTVTKRVKLLLLGGAFAGKWRSSFAVRREASGEADGRSPALAEAYAFCRNVARREAKNFYWSFRVLPRHKSDAMCAVYAFMRHADDLADDETKTLETRRAAMAAWTAAWQLSRQGETTDPLFLALNDAQRRFGISDILLEELVAGTTMDLQPSPAGTRAVELVDDDGRPRRLHIYETQEALEQYCYLVASVVGLVCIRIFGYTDPAAESLAVDTGKAFQLTNILRDVKEDAERGRIYLPQTLLESSGITSLRLLQVVEGATPTTEEVTMLRQFGQRAEDLYASADRLLPLLEGDARAAMRVLVTIYHRLLQRAQGSGGRVLHQRVSIPAVEKLSIMGRGVLESLLARRG